MNIFKTPALIILGKGESVHYKAGNTIHLFDDQGNSIGSGEVLDKRMNSLICRVDASVLKSQNAFLLRDNSFKLVKIKKDE